MGAQLNLSGEEDRQVALAQYDTPPALAARQVAMIEQGRSWWQREYDDAHILEPSAGLGSLVRALFAVYPRANVHAVELDPARVDALRDMHTEYVGLRVYAGDFCGDTDPPLALRAGDLSLRRFDLCVSNPPFSRGMETEHLARMLDVSERAILQLPIRALHGQGRMREVWGPRLGRTHWIRREVRCEERPYPNASDDIVLLDVSRREGPCILEWWTP